LKNGRNVRHMVRRGGNRSHHAREKEPWGEEKLGGRVLNKRILSKRVASRKLTKNALSIEKMLPKV